MRFGEKVKLLRQTIGLSQSQLAQELGVSKRTIQSYEAGQSYPKQRIIYQKMADLFMTDLNYLLMENEETESAEEEIEEIVEEPLPLTPEEDAQQLILSITALFDNPTFSDFQKDELMQKIQMAYWDAKRKQPS
jgi:transcriptional regulator with XRE-family HTH domain